jgi:uncharacterized lipoprotein
MLLPRWIILGCLVLVLAGCGFGKKNRGNTSKPGVGNDDSNPTYPWKRPPEDLQHPRPPKGPGKPDPF